jgi:uncharacterized membrane protein YidH (DUF202 family)
MTERDKREAIDRAHRSMERCFMAWHKTGCMTAAAAYHASRSTWELMLMKWGRA